MRAAWVLRGLAVLVIAALAAWIVHNTRWVEVEVDDPPSGAAATDPYYALRQVLAASGSTLELRTSLEPLPPVGATLVLNSSSWTVFPERDARLKAWVEAGGDLVVDGWRTRGGDTLKWIPLSFARPPQANRPASATEDDLPPTPRRRQRARAAGVPGPDCHLLEERGGASAPAFEPDRHYRGCLAEGVIRPVRVEPDWVLSGPRGTVALRVPVGRGSVTATAAANAGDDNRGLLQADNALLMSAILRAGPGRAVWYVNDESREPLLLWLWHQARTPLLLCVAATLLALWRLMVRFGPRQALPPRARRSMGEQVNGTGQFIAGADPQALHAATRQAFDDVARLRIEDYAQLDDAERLVALADALAPTTTLAPDALMAALRPGPKSTPAQWLAAIAVVEQARRALLRGPNRAAPTADSAGAALP